MKPGQLVPNWKLIVMPLTTPSAKVSANTLLQTRDGPDIAVAQGWLDAYRFWTKVFALTFALGVVSGITMSFQFGTNWPGFMEHVGNVAGPLLGYEVLTAFFLEAGFLGVMLFGHGKVSERVHLTATVLVAFGTTLSAFWILALNSWMQTPTGYEVVDGVYHVKSWLEGLKITWTQLLTW